MSWILKFTKNILYGRNFSPLGGPQRTSPCVKLPSSLTISGNTWFQNYRRKRNVSQFLPRSLPIYSGHLSKLQGEFHQCNSRIAALGCRWGMHSITFIMKIPYSMFNHRPSTLLWPHWMYNSKARSRTWTSSGPCWMVLDLQAMVWRWVSKLERLSAG